MDERRHTRLTLIGEFRLVVQDAPVDLPIGSQRLVALLGLRGRTMRGRLVTLLHPDGDERRAMANLRTRLWRVNQSCPGLLHAANGCLDLADHVVVDVRELRLQTYSPPVDRPGLIAQRPPPVEEWELLPQWDDEWLAPERERLRQLYLHAMEANARHLAAQHDYGAAVDVALAALCVDPLRESAHRTLITIYLEEDNVVEAQRALRECRRVLRSELGIDASSQTRRLLERYPRAQAELPVGLPGP